MKILIDTNVILDILCDRTDFVESSSKIWKLCEVEKLMDIFQHCLFQILFIF